LLALLAAMKQEIEPFKGQMEIHKQVDDDACIVIEGHYRGQPALLVQTGIGGHRAEMAVKHVLDHYPVHVILSLGFAGGLVSELKAGELVICRHLFHDQSPAVESTNTLVELGKRIAKPTEAGLVTVSRPASQRQEKEELAKKYSAKAVDMESYWIVAEARRRGGPCLVVRAISDPVDCDLPDLEGISSASGEWNKRKAFFHFASHPLETLRLSHLYVGHRRAKRNLVNFVNSFASAYQDQIENLVEKS
jgi:adenosylhomocysteine nucleosidase